MYIYIDIYFVQYIEILSSILIVLSFLDTFIYFICFGPCKSR